jgi:hypothetical protein
VIQVNGIEVYESHWRQTMDMIGPRAVFELNCPGPQLQFVLLRKQGRYPIEVGVQGCGRSAVYLRANMNQWVMNSQGETGNGGASPNVAPVPSTTPQPL